MRKHAGLLALLVLIIIGFGGYYLATTLGGDSDEEEADNSVAVTALEDVTSVEITCNGEDNTFVLDDGAWYCDADRDFPVDQDLMDGLVSNLSSLTASRLVDEPSGDLSDYGLDEPGCTVSVKSSSGDTVIKTGGYNSFSDSYYLMCADSIYTVDEDEINSMSLGLYDLVDYDDLPYIETDDVTSFSVQREDSVTTFTRDGESWYKETGGEKVLADAGTVEDVLSSAAGYYVYGCVNYNATGDTLDYYGLLYPFATLTINYTVTGTDDNGGEVSENRTFVLYYGDETQDTRTYVRMEGSNMVLYVSLSEARYVEYADALDYTVTADENPPADTAADD